MPRQEHVTRIPGGVPFELDLLDQDDLEARYPGFCDGKPIAWGLVVGAVSATWKESVRVGGLDWTAEFYPPGEFRAPLTSRSPTGRMRWRRVQSHCLHVAVNTGEKGLNEARDIGRPAVRSLLAILRREVPVVLPGNVIWEGGFTRPRKGRVKMTSIAVRLESGAGVSSTRLHRMGLRLAKISALTMPPQLRQALEWLSLARSASVRAEKFIHLWLAVLTLASYGQPKRYRDMTRVRNYTSTMTLGVGGVRSPLSVADLNDRLLGVYRIRNDLLHRADDSRITVSLLEQLESDAFELVDFEFAKLGTPIPAS